MEISSSQMFRNLRKWSFGAITLLFLSNSFNSLAQGEDLFKVKCATCHQVFKDGTGPKLFEVRQKWEEGGALDGSIYQWVNNFDAAMAADPYAVAVSAYSGTSMNKFPDLSTDQINAIFDWVDSQEQQVVGGDTVSTGGGANIEEKESSTGWIWIILGLVFATLIFAIGGVRRQLQSATAEAEGVEYNENATFKEEVKQWGWNNRKKVVVGAVVLTMGLVVALFLSLYTIGIVEDYQPSQPIAFPHSVHAGTNGIDCKYCHNTVTESKTAGLPTVNVCMNCHKQVTGSTPEQSEKIAKIYEAAGFDPEGGGKYTGETKPIIWNKVHNLPDHVYFNHSQHVVVGGIDCKQCHGDMTKMTETAKVQTIADLNKVEGNIKLTRTTLTMGWCIECHQEKEISMGTLDTKKDGYYDEIHKRLVSNDRALYGEYLEDGKVTVKELGGWECAKCHY
ncbi:MAG TPA: c-type cytochrome [Crocinitomicaceae bacterium]|nr:c-type cytochrome [Crocinitomicaceae bacterium]